MYPYTENEGIFTPSQIPIFEIFPCGLHRRPQCGMLNVTLIGRGGQSFAGRRQETQKEASMRLVLIDIDNTLLDFDAYIRQTMAEGFAHFGLRPYEPYMEAVFHRENNKLWRQIEQGTLTFPELERIRWNIVFAALDIHFDGPTFERYFRAAIYDSAIPVDGARELLAGLRGRYTLAAASNGPYDQQLHRLALAGMKDDFDAFFISERIGASKPSPAFFDAVFREINQGRAQPFTPAETAIIGDSLTSDMAGGRGYGLKTVYYRRPGAAPADGRVDVTVEDLRLAPALL